jgi:hypothetical protein
LVRLPRCAGHGAGQIQAGQPGARCAAWSAGSPLWARACGQGK